MKHSHYFKPVPPKATHIDVYRVLHMFQVTDPCIAHAVKKLLLPGERGSKDETKDITEAIDSLTRWQNMRAEEETGDLFSGADPFPVIDRNIPNGVGVQNA